MFQIQFRSQIKNPTLPKSNNSPPSSISSKATKVNKTSTLKPPFAKFKGSKQLQHFVTEAMEADANDQDSDYTDIDDDSMHENLT